MDYDIGKIGRVVVARLFEGEDIYAEIQGLAARENIRRATVLLVGGMRKGKIVVGPKSPTVPLEPEFREFDDAREIAGVGTIFPEDCDNGAAKLHLHAAIGRGDETHAGCPRGGATVFCVLEAVITEILDIDATRRLDGNTALKLLTVGKDS